MSRFEFVIVFLVLPRLPLRGSWRGAPERARPLMWNRRHSDSLALTKALLIAARCLCITGLALSVCCADTSPKGRGFLLTVKPSFVQPLRHGFAVPPPLVGEALAFRSALPLRQRLPYQGQQRRPPPVAETGRSCWGSGQQDASAAQGTMRMLGAATRKKRKPFQIVLLPNPHPICKLNLHLFCVLRRFSAILRQCKKLCGFCLTGGCLRVIMNT